MQILTTISGILSVHMDIVLLSLVFVCVLLLLFSVSAFFSSGDYVETRLMGKHTHALTGGKPGFFGFGKVAQKDAAAHKLKLEAKGGLGLALSDAGFNAGYAKYIYWAAQVGVALALALAMYFGLTNFVVGVRLELVLALSAGCAMIGFMLPNVFLSRRKAARLLEVEHSFPDALDMLLISMEAGASLDGALERVGREIALAHPLLSEHLLSIGHELRAGTSREAAFRRFGKRIPTDDVRSFVALFVQTDRLGTSVAQALRVHADEMRTKRVLRAEEKAHKLPVKLALPLVLFILPALITVIMTPAIIRIARNFLF